MSGKDFDIVDMNDSQAEKFAEAVKNPTSKKIWHFLKKHSASQKEISKKLRIPMPTVHYSLERLVAAGLVERHDYHWSPKGNKVHLYRASKKVMVFTPHKTPFLEAHLRAVLGIAVVLIAVLALVAFQASTFDTQDPSVVSNSNLQTFDSDAALLSALKSVGESGGSGNIRSFAADASVGASESQLKVASASASPSSDSSDFSGTNVQVAGVDEADIVKTDGDFIYLVSNGNLIIARVTPAKDAVVVSSTRLDNFYANELFIDGDRLLVFGSGSFSRGLDHKIAVVGAGIVAPGGDVTQVRLLDISDVEDPVTLRTLQFDGGYLSSRKVGDHVYFAVNSYPYYETLDTCLSAVPLFADVRGGAVSSNDLKPIAPCTDIGFVEPVQSRSFITVAAVSMSDEDEAVSKETILGSADAVYASPSSFFIAQSVYPQYGSGGVIPEVFSEGGDAVELGEPVEIDEKKDGRELPSTVVTKFNIGGGKVAFQSTGKVTGHILNQFSLDEFDGFFRIATTTHDWNLGVDDSTNSLFVLNDRLEQVGEISGIAPGERIFSARFLGERAYLVTFKQIDPLFVIDLEDPRNPSILGKLKIPGFSNYLHPIGDGFLLGIGQEVEEVGKDQFQTTGVKIAIFDVTNVEKPLEIHKEVLGGRFSSTPAQYDHRAVLFDEDKELFVLPLTLTEKSFDDNYYPTTTFQGAYVFNINPEDGFDLRGKITHYTDIEEDKFGDYYYGFDIMRSLYIGDVLFTLSNSRLQANDLDDLDVIKRLQLYENDGGDERYYIGASGGSDVSVVQVDSISQISDSSVSN